jgi:hypothetical protein
VFAVGQFGLAYLLYAMIGIALHEGHGHLVKTLLGLL